MLEQFSGIAGQDLSVMKSSFGLWAVEPMLFRPMNDRA